MSLQVQSRRQWAVVCPVCRCPANGRWYRIEAEAQKALDRGMDCRHCRNAAIVAQLPKHHRHVNRHPDHGLNISGPWYCCAAVQLGSIGMNDCDECGEPYPCPAAKEFAP